MKWLLGLLAVITLVGCDEGEFTSGCAEGEFGTFRATSRDDFQPRIVLAGASVDYDTSDVMLVGDTSSELDVVVEGDVSTTAPSDINIAVNGYDLYRLNRDEGFDSITYVEYDEAEQELKEICDYSVRGDEDSANPYDFLIYSEQIGYVTRYNSPYLWKVNPSATRQSDFLINRIDLSVFASATGVVPRMSDMALVNGELFVLLERLDNLDVWDITPDENSGLIVINPYTGNIVNPATGDEYDPERDTISETYMIDLGVKNAANLSVYGNKIFVAGRGDTYGGSESENDGGIVSIDTANNYAYKMVIDDDNESIDGSISLVELTGQGDIYFSTYVGWLNSKVYYLENGDDATTKIAEIDLGDATSYGIASLSHDGWEVYIGLHSQADGALEGKAGLKVFNASLKAVDDDRFIETAFTPTKALVLD